ncbi:MAG: nucleoside recognition domain-containing protein, partial [Azonexus sp.]
MLNKIWVAFILVGFVAAVVQLLQGDLDIFTRVLTALFDTAKTGFDISIGLVGIMSLWLGIMKIGEQAGMIQLFARAMAPLFRRLFPEVPDGHPAGGSIVMNFSANMLGLDNAATPLGLKAMRELQEVNPVKDVASNPMIMFLVLNT